MPLNKETKPNQTGYKMVVSHSATLYRGRLYHRVGVGFHKLFLFKLKIKENQKRDKYLVISRKLKKLRNMRGTVIPIVIGTQHVFKGLEKGWKEFEIGWRIENIQTTFIPT